MTVKQSADNAPRPPRLQPGTVYTLSDLIENLKIGKATFQAWLDDPDGPRPIPIGTLTHYFLADDVIRFFRVKRGLE